MQYRSAALRLGPRLALALVVGLMGIAQSADAQTRVYLPDSFAGTGPVNLVPLGGKASGSYQDIRTQIRIPASSLPSGGVTIKDLGFAAAAKGAYTWTSIRVRLAHLKGSKFSTTFDDNLAGPVVVLDKNRFRYDWPKADAFYPLGLTGKFVHDGRRDVVLDIVIRGAFFSGTQPGSRRGSKLQTVYALAYKGLQKSGYGPFLAAAKLMLEVEKGNGSGVAYYGAACAGSTSKVPLLSIAQAPRLGVVEPVKLADAAALRPALLFVGVSDKSWGALKLPFALDALGAKGCWILTDPFLPLAAATDSKGAASYGLWFPQISGLRGTGIYLQWIVFDQRANALGVVTSRGARTSLR